MKTKTHKSLRYKRAINRLHSGAARLKRMIAFTADQYHEHEFELGCQFLDLFWEGMDDDPAIGYWKRELLTKVKHLYWAWFINQKRQCELRFVNEYAEIDEVNITDLGLPAAMRQARQEYHTEMECFINSDNLHNKFQHHLIQSEIFQNPQ